MAKPQINVRLMNETAEDAKSFLRTLRDSIRHVASADYPAEVIEGWAPEVSELNVCHVLENPDNEIRVIAELDGEVVGIGATVVEQN